MGSKAGKENEIKKLRLEMNLTRERFAQLLGVSFMTVYRWEVGKCKPSPMATRAINTVRENK